MAVALRGSAVTGGTNPTTTLTFTIPAEVVADDLLFVEFTSRGHTALTDYPTVTDDDTGGNTWDRMAGTTDRKALIYWKRATSGTASKTLTIANCVDSAAGVLKAFSGGDTGATPFTNVVPETNASGNETHATFTPDNADSMLCGGVHNYVNDNSVSTLAFATAGSLTATQHLSSGGNDCGVIFGHLAQSGGPSATGNMTWAQSNDSTYSFTWAIKPAAAAGNAIPQAWMQYRARRAA